MDALSELLRAVKLSGAMFYVAECSKPWRVISPPAATLGRYLAPDASHVIEYHLVAQGSGYIRVGDRDDAVRRRRPADGAARRRARDG